MVQSSASSSTSSSESRFGLSDASIVSLTLPAGAGMVHGTSVAQGIGYAARLTILKIQPHPWPLQWRAGYTVERPRKSKRRSCSKPFPVAPGLALQPLLT